MTVIVQQPTDSNGNPQPMVYDQDTGKIIVDSNGYVINGGKRLVNVPTVSEYVNTTKSTTAGIQEAIDYVFSQNGGKIRIKTGVYSISSTSVNKYGNLINIPVNTATNGVSNSNVISISIEGESSGSPWAETSVTNNKSGVIIYVTSTAPTPPTGYYAAIFGVDPNTSNPRYVNNISLYMNKIVIMQDTPASWASYNFQFCMSLRIGSIKAQVTDATVTDLPTNTNAIGVISPMSYTDGIVGTEAFIVGHYAGILQGTSMNILHVSVFYCNVAIGGQISNPPSETNYLGHPSIITLADLQMCANYLGNSEFPLFGLAQTALSIMDLNISDAASTSPFATSSYIYAPATLPSGEGYEQIIIGYWMNYVSANVNIQDYITNHPISNLKVFRFGIYSNNYGTSVTTPSVPTSGTAQKNAYPYPVNVYIYGGTVTEIEITKALANNTYTVFNNSTGVGLSGQAFKLNPGDSITVTYTTAPTWEWLSD